MAAHLLLGAHRGRGPRTRGDERTGGAGRQDGPEPEPAPPEGESAFSTRRVGILDTPSSDFEHGAPDAVDVAAADVAVANGAATAPDDAATQAGRPPPGTSRRAVARVRPFPSPLADLPPGTAFGTLVHAVLEVADLTAPDLTGELTARCAEQLAHHPLPGVAADALAEALAPVAAHPARPARATACGWPTSPPPTGSPSWTSSCPSAAATGPCRATARSARSPRCCARHLPADDPLAALPRRPGLARRSPTSRCAATSPAASTPSCGCPAPPLRRRRLQDQLARRRRRAADRRALHARGDGRAR